MEEFLLFKHFYLMNNQKRPKLREELQDKEIKGSFVLF
jgi:hypothetical protein